MHIVLDQVNIRQAQYGQDQTRKSGAGADIDHRSVWGRDQPFELCGIEKMPGPKNLDRRWRDQAKGLIAFKEKGFIVVEAGRRFT